MIVLVKVALETYPSVPSPCSDEKSWVEDINVEGTVDR